METTMESVKFTATGFVYGNYWGGGKGSYPSRKLEANTREDLLKEANEGLNGSLDSGMGYESLIGAILHVTKITTIDIDTRLFINKETETEFIGDLTDEEQDFLYDCCNNY